VNFRTEEMLKAGFVDEVRELVSSGFSGRPPLQSVGYKEVLQFLNGEILEADLLPLIVRGTLRLAKKQRTWFQRAPETRWFDAETERPEAVRLAED
jgi:tRNA dimethylallyltransferase